MVTVLYIYKETMSLGSLVPRLNWNTNQRDTMERVRLPWTTTHSLASYSHKITSLTKSNAWAPSQGVSRNAHKQTHTLTHKHRQTHFNFHFKIYDGCGISLYEYVCAWRAFQCWAFPISNPLHFITPDRFLQSVIWLLKTPKRQKEK